MKCVVPVWISKAHLCEKCKSREKCKESIIEQRLWLVHKKLRKSGEVKEIPITRGIPGRLMPGTAQAVNYFEEDQTELNGFELAKNLKSK